MLQDDELENWEKNLARHTREFDEDEYVVKIWGVEDKKKMLDKLGSFPGSLTVRSLESELVRYNKKGEELKKRVHRKIKCPEGGINLPQSFYGFGLNKIHFKGNLKTDYETIDLEVKASPTSGVSPVDEGKVYYEIEMRSIGSPHYNGLYNTYRRLGIIFYLDKKLN